MGIDLPAFEFLLRANHKFGDFGTTLILGRQRLLVRNDADKVSFKKVLQQYRPDINLEDVLDPNVDRLIAALGGRPYHVMDNSPYQGADVIHDLNETLPKNLHGSFNTLIDIGTLEHVFNIGIAMKSMAEAVQVGGQFLCLQVANNHLGHGFWQFSPEVFFRTFSPFHGYEARLADLYYQGAFHPLRDPQSAGERLPIKSIGYTYITFGARRTAARPIFPQGWPVQADYLAAWNLFQARRAFDEGATPRAEAILRDALSKAQDNPAYMVELAAHLRRTGRAKDNEYLTLLNVAKGLAPDLPSLKQELGQVSSQKVLATSADAVPAATVTLQALRFLVDDTLVPEKTIEAMRRGRYEFKEREIARRLLRQGDRVIELGSGMGVVSLTMAGLIGSEALRCFEANPRIIELARRNAQINGLPVVFRNQIASPRVQAAETPSIDFYVLNSFEASSTRQVSPSQKSISVTTTPLEDEIASHSANVLVFDIEGFETEIVQKTDLSSIERLFFEIHPKILGMSICVGLIDELEAQGLVLRQDLVFGDVLAFDRVSVPSAISGSTLFKTLCDMETKSRDHQWQTAYDLAVSVETEIAENAYAQFSVAQIEKALGIPSLKRAELSAELGSHDFQLFSYLAALYVQAGNRRKAQQATDRLAELFPQNLDLDTWRSRVTCIPT